MRIEEVLLTTDLAGYIWEEVSKILDRVLSEGHRVVSLLRVLAEANIFNARVVHPLVLSFLLQEGHRILRRMSQETSLVIMWLGSVQEVVWILVLFFLAFLGFVNSEIH